jgi:hypothetical protein
MYTASIGIQSKTDLQRQNEYRKSINPRRELSRCPTSAAIEKTLPHQTSNRATGVGILSSFAQIYEKFVSDQKSIKANNAASAPRKPRTLQGGTNCSLL